MNNSNLLKTSFVVFVTLMLAAWSISVRAESSDCEAVSKDVKAFVGQHVVFIAKFRGTSASADDDGNIVQFISIFQCVDQSGQPLNPTGMPRGFALWGDAGVTTPWTVLEVSGTVEASLAATVDINLKKVPGHLVPLLVDFSIKPYSP